MAIERLFSSVRRIFQPERATLTENNFETQLLTCKSKLVIENTALLTEMFFVFTVETLKVQYILSYSKYSKYSKTNNEIESSEIAS